MFPNDYQGSIFICDPANNLIMRDVLVENGATFIAKRGHADSEFLASADNWFRPTWLTLGPDGAIYALDFYREVIETPLSLPEDNKKRLNLESRARGRIWRIVPESTPPFKEKPALHRATTSELVKLLEHDNAWHRTTAQRLLLHRDDAKMYDPLRKTASSSRSARARALALWLLEAKNELPDELIAQGFQDPEPGVKEQAFRLAERRLERSDDLLRTVRPKDVNDASPRVRFQIAITLGASKSPERLPHLAALLSHPQTDSWTQTAVFSSCGKEALDFLGTMVTDPLKGSSVSAKQRTSLQTVATLAGATGGDRDVSQLLSRLADGGPADWKLAVLEGLGDGRRNVAKTLDATKLKPFLASSDRTARDEKASFTERATAIRVLSHGAFSETKATFQDLLAPRNAPEIQLAVIRSLTPLADREVSGVLLERWGGYSPVVRRECTEALFARPDRLLALLDAIEKKAVSANQLEPARVALLKNHRDATIRRRAESLLAGAIAPQREKVIDMYRAALDLKAERTAGKAVFKKVCASCHRLENEGHQVGADLLAALKNKTRDQLVIDVLDPSREVDPRYQNYLVTTTKGQSLTGLLATETASSITLKRGEGAEDVLLRGGIEEIKATGLSLMPDNLETQLTRQELADLIEYLLSVGR
jgi:putative heme-binding domain-containing protein